MNWTYSDAMNTNKRPFVFINMAMSADGKVSTARREQLRISGTEDFERVDSLRASSDAIMVGIGTVLADNPSLTVKSSKRREERVNSGLPENPVRVVVDSLARTPTDSDILNVGTGRRIIAVSEQAIVEDIGRLGDKAEIMVCGKHEVDLEKLLYLLRSQGIKRLMVEGGGTLNWSLLYHGLVDEIYIYIGNMIIGGDSAPTPVGGTGFVRPDELLQLALISMEELDEGVLLRWRVLPKYNETTDL